MLSRLCFKGLPRAFSRTFYQRVQAPTVLLRSYSAMAKPAQIEKTRTKIVKLLSQEIKVRVSEYDPDQTATKEFLEHSGFTLEESTVDNSMELSKWVGNVRVRIWFRPLPPINKKLESAPGEHTIEDMELPGATFVFSVYLERQDGKALVFECGITKEEFNIRFVAIVNSVEQDKESVRNAHTKTFSTEFSLLGDDLQDHLWEYLQRFGINEQLASIIREIALEKDDKLYMKFLQDVYETIDSPIS